MNNAISILASCILFAACTDLKDDRSSRSVRTGAGSGESYDPLRPGFHYTADSNFLSDPNGLVYYNGEYHLFHQYNPYDIRSGVPQHWAHAVSRDLVHWERLPLAIHPHGGGNIWSGSAVVDKNNTSGLQKGDNPPIVAFYTWNKDFSQRMAYSNDGGRTWQEYENNPVVANIYGHNRDPKVFWHEPTGRWIMILYVRKFEIFVSDNLIDWTNTTSMEIEGFHECPDFFELAVDGNGEDTRWVVVDAAGKYYIGDFNGSVFTPESGWHYSDWNPRARQERTGTGWGEFYATQTWSNIPPEDGRRIQISCMRDARYRLPQKKFHNQMTFPCELTLRSSDEGIRLFRWPVREIENIYESEQTLTDQVLEPGEHLLLAEGDLLDIEATLKLSPSHHETTKGWISWEPLSFRFKIRGIDVQYSISHEELLCQTAVAPLKINESGELQIRILVDKISFEIFGNQGAISISTNVNLVADNHLTYLDCTGGPVYIKNLSVRKLKSTGL